MYVIRDPAAMCAAPVAGAEKFGNRPFVSAVMDTWAWFIPLAAR
jgi:hypothetical protein